jgi:hypothetical protein
MKASASERTRVRKLVAPDRSNLMSALHFLVLVALPWPSVRLDFRFPYQCSSIGAHAPKSSPEPVQVVCLGHQLSILALWRDSEFHEWKIPMNLLYNI